MEKQDPIVSTENYVQYPLTSHDGKEYEKECIYVCVCVCVYIYIYIYIYIYFFAVLEKFTLREKYEQNY